MKPTDPLGEGMSTQKTDFGSLTIGSKAVVVEHPNNHAAVTAPILFHGSHPTKPAVEYLVLNGIVHRPDTNSIGGWSVSGAIAGEFERPLTGSN